MYSGVRARFRIAAVFHLQGYVEENGQRSLAQPHYCLGPSTATTIAVMPFLHLPANPEGVSFPVFLSTSY